MERLERRCLLAAAGGVAAESGLLRLNAYIDSNDNGVVDLDDEPLSGVVLYVDLDEDGTLDADEPAATTGPSCEFSLNFGTIVVEYHEQDKDRTLEGPGTKKYELSPTNPEVEDDLLFRRKLDWGDAPDAPYPTLAASGGARHLVLPGYSLGNRVDPEPNGQPNANATGDDLGAPGDDEDGVTFLTPLISGSPATVQVGFTSTMGLTGVLDAWLDLNADGDWNDAGERIFNTQVLSAGANLLSFSVPAGSTPGPTFARFRLSPNGVNAPTGHGLSSRTPVHGEVEDYQVRIEGGGQQQLDWGDAPDGTAAPLYPTLAVNNGARHEVLPNFTLGPSIDPEANGQPNANATGDDLANIDDENGVVFTTPLVPGNAATVQVSLNGASGFLSAWIDYAADGSWAGAVDQVFNGVPLAGGVNNLNFSVPAGAKAGLTFARFRLAQTPSAITTYDGFGGRGEVEDYQVRIDPPTGQTGELDWGDAPNIPGTILQYPTLASHNGARHRIVSNFRLGGNLDPEADGQPTILSDGDDVNLSDDEDGVTFLDPLIPGQPARIRVDLLSPTGQGRLDAWIDWHGDGTWNQPIDRIATSAALFNGGNIIVVNVPSSAMTGRTYSRFRLSFNGGLPFHSFGFEGEVEDHLVEIKNPTNRKLDWGDAPELNAAGGPTAYPTTAAKNGARHVLRPGFFLGFGADAELDGQPTLDALGDDNNGVPDDEDGVTFLSPLVPGGMAQIQVISSAPGVLDAWVDFFGNANWSDGVDRIATTHPLAPGVNILNVLVPAGSKVGETYARFRLSPNGVPSYDGFGFEGEVEDYRVRIVPGGGDEKLDWGDAPKSYRTVAADDGARHTPKTGFTLGNLVDAEPDGQPSVGANRDDFSGVDDEDGVTLPAGSLMAGVNNQFVITAPGGGVLDAWIDINLDGDWADPGEKIFSGSVLAAGANVRNWVAPAGMVVGDTYARFRLSPNGVPNYFGFGFDGEVEDYIFAVKPPDQPPPNVGLDWGDAPDGDNFPVQYPTLLANDGARHSHVPGFTLGYRWDAEPNGQPSLDALRDDFAGIDDEDGVKFLTPLTPGSIAKIEVLAPNGGMLDAWIDWDADGNWTGPFDRIFTAQPLVAGSNVLSVPVPAGLPKDPYRTFSRFRLSREGVADFTGFGGDGEVEDYRIVMNGPAAITGADGYLRIIGTDQADRIALSLMSGEDGQDLLVVDDLNTEDVDFQFPAADTCWIEVFLGDGDDSVEVDGRDYLVWQRQVSAMGGWAGLATLDGGAGNDMLFLNASDVEEDLNFLISPNDDTTIIAIPPDPVHPGGTNAPLYPMGMEQFVVEAGMGNDMLLLPAVQKVSAPPMVSLLGGGGDDMLYAVDSFFDVWSDIHFDGGAQNAGGPGDALHVVGAGPGGGPHFEYLPAPGMPDSGVIAVSLNPQPEPPSSFIHFTGLEPVNFAAMPALTITLPAGASGNDLINLDPVLLAIGDSTVVSGTSSGGGFEHAIVTDVGLLTLDVADNDNGAASDDVVNFNGSIIGANAFTMPAGLADLTLNVKAGVIPINWDPGALGGRVVVDVSGGGHARFDATQHLLLLSIRTDSSASVVTGGDKVLALSQLTMAASATLDLGDHSMIVHQGSLGSVSGAAYTGITGRIQAGYNGGDWDGAGIITSMPDALTGLTSLGIARAGDVLNISGAATDSWSGETVGPNAVLVLYTYGGDANIDGIVSGDDYTAIDFNILVPGAFGWRKGDFNYDTIISGDDYTVIDFNILAQGPPLSPTNAAAATNVAAPAPVVTVGLPAMDTVAFNRVTGGATFGVVGGSGSSVIELLQDGDEDGAALSGQPPSR